MLSSWWVNEIADRTSSCWDITIYQTASKYLSLYPEKLVFAVDSGEYRWNQFKCREKVCGMLGPKWKIYLTLYTQKARETPGKIDCKSQRWGRSLQNSVSRYDVTGARELTHWSSVCLCSSCVRLVHHPWGTGRRGVTAFSGVATDNLPLLQ